MPTNRTFSHSFAGGEVSPEMFGRLDDAQFRAGVARMRNFVAKPQGPAVRRPGTRYVSTAKDSTNPVRIYRFTYSTTQTRVLEFGRATVDGVALGQIRFHTNGAPVTFAVPNAFVAPIAFSTTTSGTYTNGVDITNPNNSIMFTGAHGLATGDPIAFTVSGTGALPTVGGVALTVGTVYYAIRVDTDEIQVALTSALALSGDELDLDGAGAGIAGERKVHYAYEVADLVTNGGAYWYCRARNWLTHAGSAPATTNDYWYREPTDRIYEVPHGYAAADLFSINFAQSYDVLTLTCNGYALSELRRYGDTRWIMTAVTTGSLVAAPGTPTVAVTRGETLRINSVTAGMPAELAFFNNHTFIDGDILYVYGETAVPSLPDGFYSVTFYTGILPNRVLLKSPTTGQDHNAGGTAIGSATGSVQLASLNDDVTNYYVVTAVDANGVESVASTPSAGATNNLFVTGGENVVSWAAVSGAIRYRVYRKQSGIYGYLGTTEAATFTDDGTIAPDLGIAPPIADTTMSQPAAVAYFEGRRCFAGTPALPQTVWMTRSNTESDLSYSIPIKDNDRIQFTLASREANTIRHLVPLSHLIVLTSGAEYRVASLDGNALTPSTVTPRPQSFIGASAVRPAVVNNTIVFCSARGGHVRELGFSSDAGGYVTGDLSLRAAHLFDDLTIVDMDYGKAPWPILWLTSSDGSLLSFTYIPEEKVGAWAVHDTGGAGAGDFESVAVVAEGDEDRVYVVVRRTINGATVRMVERLDAFNYGDDTDDAYFVDCGVTATPSGTTVSGLSHLVGETVTALVDGRVEEDLVVSASGTVTLAATGTVAHVGLPLVATLRTLPVALQIPAYGQAATKSINKVWPRVTDDSGDYEIAQVDADGVLGTSAPSASFSDGVVLPGGWSPDGAIEIRVSDPTPLTVVAMTLEVAIGG